MQEVRRTNRERSETSRAALIAHGRALFIAQGYAETSTPQVAAAAGLSRGALYHQFQDKQALYRAVLEAEARAVTGEIEATPETDDPLKDLVAGARAYMAAMRVEGRTRLLLVDGPAVLGSAEARALDEGTSAATLAAGLRAARPDANPAKAAAMADLLSAAFDRAALAVDGGGDDAVYGGAVEDLMTAALASL